MITVYSKTTCPYCDAAKKFLEQHQLRFEVINIDHDTEARDFIVNQGLRTVPQIFYRGKILVEGGWAGLNKKTAGELLTEMQLRDSLANQSL
jgi:glutaredoxin